MADAAVAFRDAVTALSLANAGSRTWWYTWLASRDRIHSRLFSAYVGRESEDALAQRGSGPLRFAKEVAAAIEGRFAAWRRPAADPSAATVLVVAPSTDGPLQPADGPYRDTYFGALIEALRADGEMPVFVGLPIGDRRKTVAALARRADIPATSVYHWIRFGDIAAATVRALAVRIHCPTLELPSGANALPTIRAETGRMKAQMFFGLLIECAFRRLMKACPNARVIHTYENNPWEHAVDRAAHEASPSRYVTGYLHCAVLPSHLKNYIAPEETGLRPAPDIIVCTGPAARDVFLGLGHHDPDRVAPGCALRDPDLASTAARTDRPETIGTLLVVLEGLLSMKGAIRLLHAARTLIGDRRILLRSHPMMPLSVLLDHSGVALDPEGGFDESRQASLDDAIAEADAVIYVSSTAAMKGLAMGRPLIKIKLDDIVEDDPLFACRALKRIVRKPEELEAAIRSFEAMTPEDFRRELGEAQGYLSAYLAPPDAATLAPFRNAGPRPTETSTPSAISGNKHLDSVKNSEITPE